MLVTPSKILTYKLVDPTHSKLPLGDLDAGSFGEGRRHFNHGEADFKRRSAFGAALPGALSLLVPDPTLPGPSPGARPPGHRLSCAGKGQTAIWTTEALARVADTSGR